MEGGVSMSSANTSINAILNELEPSEGVALTEKLLREHNKTLYNPDGTTKTLREVLGYFSEIYENEECDT